MSDGIMVINQGEMLPIHRVRRVLPMTQRDFNSLRDINVNLDPSKFNSKVDIAAQGEFYISQTLKDLKDQGIKFTQVSKHSFVPTDNITKARDLNQRDRTEFKDKTKRDMHEAFKARVDTTAGTVLADVSAREVLGRMSKPFIPPKQKPFKVPDRSNGKDTGAGL